MNAAAQLELPYEPPENWRPVVGWEERYEVSDLGTVRGIAHMTPVGMRGGRIITPSWDGHYLIVGLYGGPKRKVTRRVHRLVGEAFLGQLPPGMETRHGPGGASDNRLVNLSYGTPLQNAQDKFRDGTQVHGSRQGGSKLTDALVAELRVRYAAGETFRELAERFGVAARTAHRAVVGECWRHLPGAVSGRPRWVRGLAR